MIDTLRILPPPPYGTNDDSSIEPSLGVEEGGVQSTEALSLARYFMYTQVYFHHVRRIYDIHLRDFLMDWLEGGQYPTDCEGFLKLTDNEITSALRNACENQKIAGHVHAKRIINREHFKRLYSRIPSDMQTNPEAPKLIKEAAVKEFGSEKVRFDNYPGKHGTIDFPVLLNDRSIESSLQVSDTLKHIPSVAVDYIFVDRDVMAQAKTWLEKNKNEIIKPQEEK